MPKIDGLEGHSSEGPRPELRQGTLLATEFYSHLHNLSPSTWLHMTLPNCAWYGFRRATPRLLAITDACGTSGGREGRQSK